MDDASPEPERSGELGRLASAGRPVVWYNWGALPELVVDGTTGYLVPFGDTRAVALRLGEFADNPERVLAMGRAGRERALEQFSPARVSRAPFFAQRA